MDPISAVYCLCWNPLLISYLLGSLRRFRGKLASCLTARTFLEKEPTVLTEYSIYDSRDRLKYLSAHFTTAGAKSVT